MSNHAAYRAGVRAGRRAQYRSARQRRYIKRLKANAAPGRRFHRGWGVQYHEPSDTTRTNFGYSYNSATDQQKANRRAQNYYGRGRYYGGRGTYYSGRGRFSFKRLGRKARNTGRMLGRQARRASHTLEAMAPAVAMIPGVGPELALGMEGLGEGLDEVAHVGRHIRGSGQYTAPLLNDSEQIELGQRFGAPHFSTASVNDDDGGLMISNQEFVANIYGNSIANPDDDPADHVTTKFEHQVYTVNPGLAQTFPMLSQFAVNFERYEMIQCVFHFETALDSGVLQSETGQVGDVLMYSHVDPTEPPFESVADFMSNGGSLTQVTKGLACGVECDPSQLAGLPNAGLNLVRAGPQIDSKQQEADQATLEIAVADTPAKLAGQVIGKLYVSYTVKLIKPRLVSLQGGNIMHDSFVAAGPQTIDGNDIKIVPPLGGPARLPHSNIGGMVSSELGGGNGQTQIITYTMPPWLNGVFKLRLRLLSDDPPLLAGMSTLNTGAAANNIYQLIQTVATTGNVKVLPHSIQLVPDGPAGGDRTGQSQCVYYNPNDNFDDADTPFKGAIDNFLLFRRDNAEATSRLYWAAYFEVTFRCSPATANQDNTVVLTLPSGDNQSWPTPTGTGAIRCYFKMDVESSNGFDIPSTTKLVTHMESLTTRNTDLAAYEANPQGG